MLRPGVSMAAFVWSVARLWPPPARCVGGSWFVVVVVVALDAFVAFVVLLLALYCLGLCAFCVFACRFGVVGVV